MPEANQWTCEGCGYTQTFRKIDSYRWITSSVSPAGARLSSPQMFELCPACQLRLRFGEYLEFQKSE